MKKEKPTSTREMYERPALQTVPLVMESEICGSQGTLQQIIFDDPYDETDLG